MTQVLISLSSFGAAETGRHGQLWCAQLAKAAGADSVEVRGELLRDPASELPALAGLASVYSSPEGLWAEGGWLDSAALGRGIAAATTLGAKRLKMSIGAFGPSSHGSLWGLKVQLAETRVELVIENDQTVSAGTLPALQTFFDVADRAGLDLGMTFDMGNWQWPGEIPLDAARLLAAHVEYIHCKAVTGEGARRFAVAPAADDPLCTEVLQMLPRDVPRGIEFPFDPNRFAADAAHYVAWLAAA